MIIAYMAQWRKDKIKLDNGVSAEGASSASIVTLNLKTDNIVVLLHFYCNIILIFIKITVAWPTCF